MRLVVFFDKVYNANLGCCLDCLNRIAKIRNEIKVEFINR
jgi:hypothetical protein